MAHNRDCVSITIDLDLNYVIAKKHDDRCQCLIVTPPCEGVYIHVYTMRCTHNIIQ